MGWATCIQFPEKKEHFSSPSMSPERFEVSSDSYPLGSVGCESMIKRLQPETLSPCKTSWLVVWKQEQLCLDHSKLHPMSRRTQWESSLLISQCRHSEKGYGVQISGWRQLQARILTDQISLFVFCLPPPKYFLPAILERLIF
jgi:hypothetical protein